MPGNIFKKVINIQGVIIIPGTISNSTLRWNGSNWIENSNILASSGKLGIGIIPVSKLHVKGAGVDSATSSFNVTDSVNNSILFVRDDGRVGIGTDNVGLGPRLQISSKASGSPALRTLNTLGNKNVDLGNIASDHGGISVFQSDGIVEVIRLTSTFSGDSFVGVGNTGKFGIGISTPDDFLHIQGSLGGKGIHVDSSSGAGIHLNRGSTANGCLVLYSVDGSFEWFVGTMSGEGGVSDYTIYDNINSKTRFHIKNSNGHIGINTNNPATSALLDLTSTTGALLISRMTTGQRDALTAVNGMSMYNTSTNQFNFYENGAWITK